MAPSAKGLEFEVFLSSDCGPIGPGRDDDPSPFPSVPPRLVSDQLINIYFQEWAPLFPALHRPSFLVLYEKYVSNPQTVTDNEAIAQLNLIFAIAALSCQVRCFTGLATPQLLMLYSHATTLTQNLSSYNGSPLLRLSS